MPQDEFFPHAMSEQDAMFWNLERGTSLSSTVAAVSLLDRMPDRDLTLRKLVRATRRIPRLRQRVVVLPRLLSTPVWEECADFDLSYHVRWVSAPGDGSLAGVLELAASASSPPCRGGVRSSLEAAVDQFRFALSSPGTARAGSNGRGCDDRPRGATNDGTHGCHDPSSFQPYI